MDEFLIALLAAAGATLTGRSLLFLFDRVFGTRKTRRPLAEIWGTSILLGISFTPSSGFVWSDMGQELGPHFSWRQAIIGGLLGILAEYRSRRLVANTPPLPVAALSSVQVQIIWICRVIVCASVLGATVLTLRNTEPADGERLAIEDKAQVMFETRTVFAPELVHPEIVESTSRDPLLLPLFERHVYALLGRISQPWARIWSPLAYAGLLLSFIGIVGRRVHPAWAWGSAVGMMLLLLLDNGLLLPDRGNEGVSAALPTLPAVCFHGVAILYLWDAWLNAPGGERVRGILLAAGMASSICFIRNDGFSLLLIDCLCWGVAVFLWGSENANEHSTQTTRLSKGRNLLAIVFFLLFAVFLLNPWLRYRMALPSQLVIADLAIQEKLVSPGPSPVPSILLEIGQSITRWTIWPIGLCLLISLIPARSIGVQTSSTRFLKLNAICSFGMMFALQFVSSATLIEALGKIDRSSFTLLIPVFALPFCLSTAGPLPQPQKAPRTISASDM